MEKTGIDRSTLSKLENGRGGITEDKARLLGPVVGIDPADLMSVASPSLLATMREVERLVRTLAPEQPALIVPDDQELERHKTQTRSKAAQARKRVAG